MIYRTLRQDKHVIDQKTLQHLKERDPVFLESLFKETNPYLFKILGANKIFSEQAQDIVQASWETFFKNLDQFRGQSQIKVFIAGILLNKVREHRRALKKVVYEEDSEKVYSQSFSTDGWWMTGPSDPQKLIESKESIRFIDECLEGLSELQREAFLLKVVEHEKTEEICNILKINVSHIGVLLFRAKDKLRQCLEGKTSSL